MTDTNEVLYMAKLGFDAYCERVGGKNVAGQAIPSWGQLGENVQAGWIANAEAIYNYLMGPEAADE